MSPDHRPHLRGAENEALVVEQEAVIRCVALP